jgi:hypothetical protein
MWTGFRNQADNFLSANGNQYFNSGKPVLTIAVCINCFKSVSDTHSLFSKNSAHACKR